MTEITPLAIQLATKTLEVWQSLNAETDPDSRTYLTGARSAFYDATLLALEPLPTDRRSLIWGQLRVLAATHHGQPREALAPTVEQALRKALA